MILSINKITSLLRSYGFDVLAVVTGLSKEPEWQPMLIFDHQSYPGVEAHVVAAAHSALWIPKLDDNGDIIVYNLLSTNIEEHLNSWDRLLRVLGKLSQLLHPYRNRALSGHLPSVIWAHHEIEWYRDLRKAPYSQQQPTSDFIEYVDPSIRDHITSLNDCGFTTIESCSGLAQDHPDRNPYRPYVMLDERAYPNCIPHLFTLADIAGWIPGYAPHNFDVYIRIQGHCPIVQAWNKLVQSARVLDSILKPYRELVSLSPSGIDELDILHDSLGTSLVNR